MLDWEKFGYIVASKYRKGIVSVLNEGPRTPKDIAQELDLYISHISSTLSELEEKNIVRCLTPRLRKGRIYGLTEAGKKIAAEIEKRGT